MKNTIIIILLAITILSCKAQTTRSIYDDGFSFEENIYYKDTHNDMNKIEGTWVYENGPTKITLVLQKRTLIYEVDDNNYFDEIIGGYKYELNNQIIVNTIPDIDLTLGLFANTIAGCRIIKNNTPPICTDCPPNDKRFLLHWHEPLAKYLRNRMVIKYFNASDEDYIQVDIFDEISLVPDGVPDMNPRLPFGVFLFIKQ